MWKARIASNKSLRFYFNGYLERESASASEQERAVHVVVGWVASTKLRSSVDGKYCHYLEMGL